MQQRVHVYVDVSGSVDAIRGALYGAVLDFREQVHPVVHLFSTKVADVTSVIWRTKKRYRAAKRGNYDLYVVFVQRGMELLHSKGQLSYILPQHVFQCRVWGTAAEAVGRGKTRASCCSLRRPTGVSESNELRVSSVSCQGRH